ncbi:MAG: hypothetical protein HY914_17705 [Desulfomonile tiedjei]|nr:hypothetical protein [Desulfomonile tiedjei]
MKRFAFWIYFCCLLIPAITPNAVCAQEEKPAEKVRDGLFEITLKTREPDARKMIVDTLVRDRDLDPSALFRVKAGGYLGFDESEWVDKIEFKVDNPPVTELPEYKRFASLLVEINRKSWDIKEKLSQYDVLALRLLDICGKHRFSNLQAIDENVSEQLTAYRKLVLLRSLVVNSLNRFIADRSCRDKFKDYNKTLNIYSKQLDELSHNVGRLGNRAVNLSQELSSGALKEDKGKTGEDSPETPEGE